MKQEKEKEGQIYPHLPELARAFQPPSARFPGHLWSQPGRHSRDQLFPLLRDPTLLLSKTYTWDPDGTEPRTHTGVLLPH